MTGYANCGCIRCAYFKGECALCVDCNPELVVPPRLPDDLDSLPVLDLDEPEESEE